MTIDAHAREPLTTRAGTNLTFATDGIDAALERAQAAAGHKDVLVVGGSNIAHQYWKAVCSTGSTSTWSPSCWAAESPSSTARPRLR